MGVIFEVPPLKSLPWPAGLGKQGSYKGLEKAMRALLGDDDLWNPDAHRHAFVSGNTEYRRLILDDLCQWQWSANLVAAVDTATALARSSPLLNRRLELASTWYDWAAQYRDVHGYPVWCWLTSPVEITNSAALADGRHRLTFLRYHQPADHKVLVCTHRD